MNFAKFLRTPILKKICERLPLTYDHEFLEYLFRFHSNYCSSKTAQNLRVFQATVFFFRRILVMSFKEKLTEEFLKRLSS